MSSCWNGTENDKRVKNKKETVKKVINTVLGKNGVEVVKNIINKK